MKQNQASASSTSTNTTKRSKPIKSKLTLKNRQSKSLDSDSSGDDNESDDTDEEEGEWEENFRSIGYESKGLQSLLSCQVIEQDLLPLKKVLDPIGIDRCVDELVRGSNSSISSRKPTVYRYDLPVNS